MLAESTPCLKQYNDVNKAAIWAMAINIRKTISNMATII